jgi:SAM-dependent methyltransferase
MAQSCRTVRAFGFFPAGTRSILVAIRKFLLLPGLIRASVRLRRRGARGWKQFWSGVQRTGPGGDVLWDVAERTELDRCLQRTGRHFDPALPVVDLGCGNGRFTRLLAGRFPVVVGIDVAASAVRLAEAESAGQPGVSYRVVDGGRPGRDAQPCRRDRTGQRLRPRRPARHRDRPIPGFFAVLRHDATGDGESGGRTER